MTTPLTQRVAFHRRRATQWGWTLLIALIITVVLICYAFYTDKESVLWGPWITSIIGVVGLFEYERHEAMADRLARHLYE